MRKKIYSHLTADGTLNALMAGGWHTFGKVTTPLPRTPFGVIRIAGELPDMETQNPDKVTSSILSELYVYDKIDKRGNTIIASYVTIDQAIERIYALMNRHYFDLSDYSWGSYFDTILDTISPDLRDDGWLCSFKYIRFVHRVAR